MAERKNYFTSEHVEVMRSELRVASYNPRIITEEGRRALKKSIKTFGVVGGIVVNQKTGNTIVGGHQKVAILDELNKYKDGENDYPLRVELIDVDEKTEKELNVTLNNPNVGGEWDYDMLRDLVPDIDFRNVGFTDADLSYIGVDKLFTTDDADTLATDIADMMSPVYEEHAAEVEARAAERKSERAIAKERELPKTDEEKKAHVKEVKRVQMEQAANKGAESESYIVLSFDDLESKGVFCETFGYDIHDKFIKGEDFLTRLMSEDDEGDEEETADDED